MGYCLIDHESMMTEHILGSDTHYTISPLRQWDEMSHKVKIEKLMTFSPSPCFSCTPELRAGIINSFRTPAVTRRVIRSCADFKWRR